MVCWVWIPVSLFVGAFIGLFLYSLCAVSDKGDGNN